MKTIEFTDHEIASQHDPEWTKLKNIVNPDNESLVMYYPGSGGDAIHAHMLGIKTQIQVCQYLWYGDPWSGVFAKGKMGVSTRPKNTPLTYRKGDVNIVDYYGDVFEFLPPEAREVDILFNKCAIKFNDKHINSKQFPNIFSFRKQMYDLIKTNGFYFEGDRGTNHFVKFVPQEYLGFETVYFSNVGTDRFAPQAIIVHKKVIHKDLSEEFFKLDSMLTLYQNYINKLPNYYADIKEHNVQENEFNTFRSFIWANLSDIVDKGVVNKELAGLINDKINYSFPDYDPDPLGLLEYFPK